jgi:uncharacterized protein YlzI (FlbEa/FlbD family)
MVGARSLNGPAAGPTAVITLTNGTKLVVAGAAEDLVAVVRRWRVDIMAEAMRAA